MYYRAKMGLNRLTRLHYYLSMSVFQVTLPMSELSILVECNNCDVKKKQTNKHAIIIKARLH